jgi:hypothetical protein
MQAPPSHRSRQVSATRFTASPAHVAVAAVAVAVIGIVGHLALASGAHPASSVRSGPATGLVSTAPAATATPEADVATVTAWCSGARQTAETFSEAKQAQAAVATAADNVSPYNRSAQLQAKLDALNKVISLYNRTEALFKQLASGPPAEISADMAAISTIQPTTVVASDRDRLVAAKANVASYSSSHCDTLLDVEGILTDTADASADS